MPARWDGPLPPDDPIFKGPSTVFLRGSRRPPTDGKQESPQEQCPPPGRKDQDEE